MRHGRVLRAAGAAWIVGTAFFVFAQVLRTRTTAAPTLASVAQVIGVTALVLSVLGILWGLISLAALAGDAGDRTSAILLWAVVVGIALLPLLFIGSILLLPALAAMAAIGRVGGENVRLPALAVFAGLLTAGAAAGWKAGVEGPLHLNVLVFVAAAAHGAAWIWFGSVTEQVGPTRPGPKGS